MIALALQLALLGSPPQQDGPTFTRFQFAREKTFNKVTTDAQLNNTLQENLKDLRIIVVFYSGGEELRRSDPKVIKSLPAGKLAKFSIETLRVPRFDSYEVILWHSGGKLVYEGKEFDRPPSLKAAAPAVLELVDHGDRGPETFPGDAAVRFVVQNTGESPARTPIALLNFKDDKDAQVLLKRVRLPEAIPPFVEQTFEVTVPAVPRYASVTPKVVWLTRVLISMDNPPGKAQGVETRDCRIVLLTDGSVRITGRVLNGLGNAVDKVRITFKLGKRSCPVAFRGAIPPGAGRSFEIFVPDCPDFKSTGFSVSYDEAKKGARVSKEQPRLTATRVASKALERETEPPPPVTGGKTPADAAARNILRAQITGVKWVKGMQIKNTYTGDVGFLKLQFTDGRGKAVRPTGSLSIVILNGNEVYRRVSRNINSASWGHDLTKIKTRNASHQLVGCDPDSGEAWVGFIRNEGQFFGLRLQVTLKLRRKGTWIWKDLEEPFSTSPREADKK